MSDSKQPKEKGFSIIGELGFSFFAFALMIGGLVAAHKLEDARLIPADAAFIIKDFSVYLAKVSFVLLICWLYKKIGFPNTFGIDFKERFNRGWKEMDDASATRWMIILFLGLFLGASILMLS